MDPTSWDTGTERKNDDENVERKEGIQNIFLKFLDGLSYRFIQ